jgi:hypothetical protein
MKNENLVSEEKQIFSDNYAEPIVKYARQLQRKQSMLKNTLASLDGCVAKEPNKKKGIEFNYCEIFMNAFIATYYMHVYLPLSFKAIDLLFSCLSCMHACMQIIFRKNFLKMRLRLISYFT